MRAIIPLPKILDLEGKMKKDMKKPKPKEDKKPKKSLGEELKGMKDKAMKKGC